MGSVSATRDFLYNGIMAALTDPDGEVMTLMQGEVDRLQGLLNAFVDKWKTEAIMLADKAQADANALVEAEQANLRDPQKVEAKYGPAVRAFVNQAVTKKSLRDLIF